jgi:hypothetical protein
MKATIIKSIQSAGSALRLAIGKASALHNEVLTALTGIPKEDIKAIKPRTVQAWFELYLQIPGMFWPMDTEGQPVGYRTVMRKATEYKSTELDLAYYFNNFQAWLYFNKLVQKSGKEATKSGKVHVVQNADLVKRLEGLYMAAPEDRRNAKTLKSLQSFAKLAFGINFELPNHELASDTKHAKHEQVNA